MAGIATCMAGLRATPLVCLNGVVATIINLAFMFVGAVTVIFFLYGGLKYILSSGDSKAVKSARDTMTYAAVGAILLLSIYIIAHTFARMFVPGGEANLFNFKITPPGP